MKTACPTQCPVCPFRKTSLNSWLGSYTVSSVLDTIWKGLPFFCHTRASYNRDDWAEKLEANGKLCLGGLAFSDKIMAPPSDDPEVRAARESIDKSQIECMEPKEFQAHHSQPPSFSKKTTKNPKANPKGKRQNPKPKPEPVARKRTDDEVEEEVAKLRVMAPKIVQFSKFGDDNRAKIDAQIDALAGFWDEDDLDREYDLTDEDFVEEHGGENNVEEMRNAALTALLWRDGQSSDTPSEDWEPLLQ